MVEKIKKQLYSFVARNLKLSEEYYEVTENDICLTSFSYTDYERWTTYKMIFSVDSDVLDTTIEATVIDFVDEDFAHFEIDYIHLTSFFYTKEYMDIGRVRNVLCKSDVL